MSPRYGNGGTILKAQRIGYKQKRITMYARATGVMISTNNLAIITFIQFVLEMQYR